MSRRLLLLEEGGGPEPMNAKIKYGFAILDNMTPVASITRNVSFADLGWVDGSPTQTITLARQTLDGYTYVKGDNECILVTKAEGFVDYNTWSSTANKRVNKFANICIKFNEYIPSGSSGQIYTDPNTTSTTSLSGYYNVYSNLFEFYNSGTHRQQIYTSATTTTSVNTYPIKLVTTEMTTTASSSNATATFNATFVLLTNVNYMNEAEILNINGANSYLNITNEVYITDKLFSSLKAPLIMYNS